MNALSPTQRKAVCDLWDEVEQGNEGVSTSRLFAMVTERATAALGREVDEGDVSEALYMREQRRGQA